VEFALVFSVFFVVLYGVLTYGFIFLAQHSLNLAAEDGVRAALRWQGGSNAMALRAGAAMAVANDRASWVSAMGSGKLVVAICNRASPTSQADPANPPPASGASAVLLASNQGTCSGSTMADDQMEVLVSYDYGASPLIPTLPGMSLAIPGTLSARATARLGNGMTTLASGG
jgi:Flp pilus assembly protein TadG